MIELGLEVEALEEPLYVSSPLGIRARIGMICRGCELEISGILVTVDLRVMDMSEFDIIVEYTKEKQLYWNLVPSGHTLLTLCIRIGTFYCFHVSGLVQVFQVSCIIVTRVRVQKANMDH